MASTNKTEHYDLSQFVPLDKPAWLGDYNSDMQKIDAGIYAAQSKADRLGTEVEAARAAATAAQQAAQSANEAAQQASEKAQDAETTANGVAATASQALTTAQQAQTAVNNVESILNNTERVTKLKLTVKSGLNLTLAVQNFSLNTKIPKGTFDFAFEHSGENEVPPLTGTLASYTGKTGVSWTATYKVLGYCVLGDKYLPYIFTVSISPNSAYIFANTPLKVSYSQATNYTLVGVGGNI